MGRSTVFRIDPTGERTRVRGLHAEGFQLARMGHVRVRRASHVEFNEPLQVWEARDHETGRLIARHAQRDACIEAEIRYYNREMDAGGHPFRHWKLRRLFAPVRRLATYIHERVRGER